MQIRNSHLPMELLMHRTEQSPARPSLKGFEHYIRAIAEELNLADLALACDQYLAGTAISFSVSFGAARDART
jgi:hypothetical protein